MTFGLSKILSIMSLSIPTIVFGVIINVPEDYAAIQTAVDESSNGDTVLVADGEYYENVRFHGREILLGSHYILDWDLDHVFNTIINGSASTDPDTGSCVLFVNHENENSILSGFTLTGGTGTVYGFENGAYPYREGGAILMDSSSAQVKQNLIISNDAFWYRGADWLGGGGGGLSSMYGNPQIIGNVFMYNTARYAAAIVLNWSGGVVKNNIIYANSGGADFGCGGLMLWNSPDNTAFVVNNTIIRNESSQDAGGLTVENTSAMIRNNIIWGNQQARGGQIVGATNSIFEYNGLEWLEPNNLETDPGFSDFFQLSNTSNCIDAGHPGEEYYEPNLLGMVFPPAWGAMLSDIGAYGGPFVSFLPVPTIEYLLYPVEVNFPDVYVGNLEEFQLLLRNEGTVNCLIDSIKLNAGSVLYFGSDSIAATIGPLAVDTLSLIWQPTETSNLADTLKIYHSWESLDNPVHIPILGLAVENVAVRENPLIPEQLNLYQNFPNPFNPSTIIKYDLREHTEVSLIIYDAGGREVNRLVSVSQSSGSYAIRWDGTNDEGQQLAGGVYFARLQAGEQSGVVKMVYLR